MDLVTESGLSARARLMKTRRGTWVDESLFPEARRECLEIVERAARELEDSGIVEMLRGERKRLGETQLGERISRGEETYSRYGWWNGSWQRKREAMELLAERANEYELPEEHEAWVLAWRAHYHTDRCGACADLYSPEIRCTLGPRSTPASPRSGGAGWRIRASASPATSARCYANHAHRSG